MSVHGSKLGVSKLFVGGTLVGLEEGDTGVTVLGQEYLM